MPGKLEPVMSREIRDSIRSRKVVLSWFWTELAPLHGVFRDEAVEVPNNHVPELVEGLRLYGNANRKVLFDFGF
jgi:hypothetical protein